MSKQEVVEVYYGKHHKYEIIKTSGIIASSSYALYRDGKYFKGSYDSLADAVDAAKQAG